MSSFWSTDPRSAGLICCSAWPADSPGSAWRISWNCLNSSRARCKCSICAAVVCSAMARSIERCRCCCNVGLSISTWKGGNNSTPHAKASGPAAARRASTSGRFPSSERRSFTALDSATFCAAAFRALVKWSARSWSATDFRPWSSTSWSIRRSVGSGRPRTLHENEQRTAWPSGVMRSSKVHCTRSGSGRSSSWPCVHRASSFCSSDIVWHPVTYNNTRGGRGRDIKRRADWNKAARSKPRRAAARRIG